MFHCAKLKWKNVKLTHNSTEEVMMNKWKILRWKDFGWIFLKYQILKNIHPGKNIYFWKYSPLRNIHSLKNSPLKNIHPWKIFTHENIHPLELSTPEKYSLLKNIQP